MNFYTLILDRSGSMESIWDDITQAVNHHISEKSKSKLTSLLLFDTEGLDFLYKYENNPTLLDKENFKPRGWTPLRDAIIHGIKTLVEEWGDFLWQDFIKVEFTIFTDGEENSSRWWTAQDVARTIDHFQTAYDWKFNFIGAGQQSDVENYAAQFAIKKENCVGYTKKEELESAFAKL